MKTKWINIELSEDLHRRMKADAAKQGTTIQDYVVEAIVGKVEKCSKK